MQCFLFLIISLLFSLASQAFGLPELSQLLQKPQSVQGQFVQERYLKSLTIPLKSSGSFVLIPQKVLLWQAAKPFQVALRISPKGIEQYSNTTHKWFNPKQDSHGIDLFLDLFGGDTQKLKQYFNINVEGNASHWQVTLLPNNPLIKQIFKKIILSGSQSIIQSANLYETQGDHSRITFSSTKVNTTLSSTDQSLLK